MKHVKWLIIVFICAVTTVNLSCSRNVFDQEKYQEIIDSLSPVDTIDPNHDWILNASKVLIVNVPEIENVERIQVLTANPREKGDAEIVGEAFASSGDRVTMSISYPKIVSTLYVAAVDEEGYYTISSFAPATTSIINFDEVIVDHEKISYEPQPQQFTYCFEEEYPQPGDYDYNDVVVRIAQKRTGEKEMRFDVQLAAVGGMKQLAACIRLINYKYDDIESVKTVDDLSFNKSANGKEIADQMLVVLKDKSVFLRGRNNEAVINLFVDAHWATGDLLDENYGVMTRKKYNVANSSGGDYQMMVPRKISYVVTFKDASDLNNLSMDKIDPFIIEEYNGGFFEVHTYIHRSAQVLNPYPTSPVRGLPWALSVPSSNFCWPLEGVNMGFLMKKATFGAYQTMGHSFGHWAMDQTKALDWYLFPSETRVFRFN